MSFQQGEDKMNLFLAAVEVDGAKAPADDWKIGAWFSAQKQKVRSEINAVGPAQKK